MKKRTPLYAIGFLLLTLSLTVHAEQSFWEKRITTFDYNQAQISSVVSNLEQLSQQLDVTEGRGVRFIMPNSLGFQSLTLHLTNTTFKDLVHMVAELGGMRVIIGKQNAYLCSFQETGPPTYHRGGLRGQLSDEHSGEPITNAVFVSERHITNSVFFQPDGRFVGAIDYYVYRPFCDGITIYRKEDDEFTFDVSAPGYDTKSIKAWNGDGHPRDLSIQLKKQDHDAPTQ